MATAAPAYNPTLPVSDIGARAVYRARAMAFLGISQSDSSVAEFFDEFSVASSTTVIPGWTFANGGTGALATQVAASGGGQLRLTTGANASSASGIQGTVGLVSNVSTKKYYVAWKFSANSAVDAATICYVGLLNAASNKTIGVGAFGANSTTNFVLQYDGNETGTFLTTGVAIDTAKHVVEIYGTASAVVNVRFDGTAISATQASAPSDFCHPRAIIRNGTTASAETMDIDFFYGLSIRT